MQMDLNLTVITRDGYQMLDVFSDVGGLRVALLAGISVLLNVWNHNYLDSYMASKLFKSGGTNDGGD